MNRDFILDREPLPVPVATREILGGGGLKLHAREWGNAEGYPLLFIHGWSQSDLCWLKQVRGELADTSRMVTFDLRGHGLSEKPPGPEHYADGQLWADDLAAVIDQSGLEQPVLVSWSYGGYVVADYLRAYGDAHIGGINLAGSATILRPPAFDHIGPGLLENAQDMCVPDLFANIAATRRFLRACTSRPLGDDELAAALAWNMVVPPAIRGALLSRELDSSDVLARTSVPVLVSHGRDDMIVLPSMAEQTLTACPAASVSWYDGVGHMPFWEAPDRFDRELADLAHAARSPQPMRSGSLGRPRRDQAAISKSTVSAICGQIKDEYESWAPAQPGRHRAGLPVPGCLVLPDAPWLPGETSLLQPPRRLVPRTASQDQGGERPRTAATVA